MSSGPAIWLRIWYACPGVLEVPGNPVVKLLLLVEQRLDFVFQCTHLEVQGVVGTQQLLLCLVARSDIVKDALLLLSRFHICDFKPPVRALDVVIINLRDVFEGYVEIRGAFPVYFNG